MTQPLDLHWVTPDLAIGGAFPMSAAPRLARDLRIGAVVDLREEDCDACDVLAAHGIAFLHLPTPDRMGVSHAHLVEGVGFLRALPAGTRTLIHCQHGIGRSALLALCVMVDRGEAPFDALLRAKNAREKVSPSPEQFAAWTAWLEVHRAETSVPWELPDFDGYCRIAYRHLAGIGTGA